jgi:RNA polymerase sigma-70 factor (ECF subfamily)
MDPLRRPGLIWKMTDMFVAAGNFDSFETLVAPYRSELRAYCYRMLGSVHGADDALQDALLRAWRALPKFEGRSWLRSWPYTIATNSCLRLIERGSAARSMRSSRCSPKM